MGFRPPPQSNFLPAFSGHQNGGGGGDMYRYRNSIVKFLTEFLAQFLHPFMKSDALFLAVRWLNKAAL